MDGRAAYRTGGAEEAVGRTKELLNREPAPRYRARPLNGVWATAPYLHNGSVASLNWLLRPAAERPRKFCMGARDFDPEHVGFDVKGDETRASERPDAVFGDRSRRKGHPRQQRERPLVRGAAPYPRGIVGRALGKNEREALIEYPKTL